MNSAQRVKATFEGKETDRRAFCPLLSLYGARLAGHSLQEHYTSPAAYVRGQRAAKETFQPDVLTGPFALVKEGAAFGSQYRLFENQPPNISKPACSDAPSFAKLATPDVDSHPDLLYLRECIRSLANEFGSEIPIAAIISGPVDIGALIFGIENWLNTLLFDEIGARKVLESTISFFVRWTNSLFSDGAQFAVLPAAFTNPRIIPRKLVQSIALPAMKEAFSQIKGSMLIHSASITIAPYLDLYKELPNVAGYILNEDDDFGRAREIVGPEPVLMGNIAGPSLFLQEKEEVVQESLKVLEDRKDDPRFILSTSMADIDLHTPPENIHALWQAIEEHARKKAQ